MLGPFKVGDGARVAAQLRCAVEVPENATVVGVPGKIVRIGDQKVHYADNVDQIHDVIDPMDRGCPDPSGAYGRTGTAAGGKVNSPEHSNRTNNILKEKRP